MKKSASSVFFLIRFSRTWLAVYGLWIVFIFPSAQRVRLLFRFAKETNVRTKCKRILIIMCHRWFHWLKSQTFIMYNIKTRKLFIINTRREVRGTRVLAPAHGCVDVHEKSVKWFGVWRWKYSYRKRWTTIWKANKCLNFWFSRTEWHEQRENHRHTIIKWLQFHATQPGRRWRIAMPSIRAYQSWFS